MQPIEEAFTELDRKAVVARYSERFEKYGYSQLAVGWGAKGRQELRFGILHDGFNFLGKRILDLGAGFGDFFKFIGSRKPASYVGLELTPDLVAEGLKLHGNNRGFELRCVDLTSLEEFPECDIAVASGLFNFKLANGRNYEFIESVLRKAHLAATDGVAVNFITDRVDYREELIFNSQPERILEIALSISRNVVMRFDYMPFEFTVYIYRDDSFDRSDAIFSRFKSRSANR